VPPFELTKTQSSLALIGILVLSVVSVIVGSIVLKDVSQPQTSNPPGTPIRVVGGSMEVMSDNPDWTEISCYHATDNGKGQEAATCLVTSLSYDPTALDANLSDPASGSDPLPGSAGSPQFPPRINIKKGAIWSLALEARQAESGQAVKKIAYVCFVPAGSGEACNPAHEMKLNNTLSTDSVLVTVSGQGTKWQSSKAKPPSACYGGYCGFFHDDPPHTPGALTFFDGSANTSGSCYDGLKQGHCYLAFDRP
jgi:hypothetical protein